jgi:hypothetical protein
MKAMCKFELAAAAGVSRDTFRRWLLTDIDYLRSQGVSPNAKIFPPQVIRYLCEKYDIEITK